MTGIELRDTVEGLTPAHLGGFFEGWPDPPSPETHLAVLRGSHAVVVALDPASGRVVGFVNAISDGVLAAFIPLLEVLPSHRGRGLGSALVRRLLTRLEGHYSIDLVCDPELLPFYERLGLKATTAASRRDCSRRSGRR